MLKTSSLVLTCALVLGCGGEAPPARAPEPAPSAAPAPVAPLVRQPSAEVAKFWVFPSAPPIAVFADLHSLLGTELMRALVPDLVRMGTQQGSGSERACVTALTENAHDFLLGGDQENGLIVLSLGAEGVKAARTACVGAATAPARAQVAGSDEAYALGQVGVAALSGNTVLIGDQPMVEAALKPGAKALPLPSRLALTGDQHAAFVVDLGGVQADGSLVASPSLFGVRARVALPSEALATQIEQQVAAGRGRVAGIAQGPEAAELERILQGFRVERQGSQLQLAFEILGKPAQQAKDLGLVTSLAVFGVQRYMQNAKAAEAKAVLARITKAYQVALTDPEGAKTKKPKKLVSLPPVPATVPRGVEYQSSAADWKAWAPIAFGIDMPQHYQYEVVAAKDGKSAEVRAKGDLDGDGVTSLYVLKITLDPKTGQITAQGLDESEPLE